MNIEDAARSRIQQLMMQGCELAQGNENGAVRDDRQQQECIGWLISAQHIIKNVCQGLDTPYLEHAERIASTGYGFTVNLGVGEMTALLRHLLADAEAGLLSSVVDRARAETFDDFLDHADHYLHEDRKNESGVIAGVVFEDTIRRICRRLGMAEKGVKIDNLISDLAKAGELSGTKAKRARTAADVRTKASHAQWDEFDRSDVQAAIDITRELVSTKLDR